MFRRTIGILMVAFIVALGVAYAADEPSGANSTFVTSDRAIGTDASNQTAFGGNVTAVNINATIITDRWAGFYGNISGEVRLGDSANNLFYQWTITDVTGVVVFAANNTVSDWSTIAAATVADMPSYLQANATDNFSNTFRHNEAFSTNSLSVADANFTYTLNDAQADTFKTYALLVDTNTIVFAGSALNDETGFDSTTVDYQILAPARLDTLYFFYVELP